MNRLGEKSAPIYNWMSMGLAMLAILVGFFLFAVAPRRAPTSRIETLEMLEEIGRERRLEKLTYISFGLFFWIALLALITVIIVRYAL